MPVSAETLSQVPIFARLGPRARLEVAAFLREQTIGRGEAVVWEGAPCETVHFVVRGLLRVRRMSSEGREQVLALLGPGSCLNLVPALDGGLSPATVDAVVDSVLLATSCAQFQLFLHDHQEIAQAVMMQLAGEVRRLGDMVEELALHTVRTRLARFLLANAEGKGLRPAWTQQEIAASIGTVREMVGRTLRALGEEGLIRRERGRIAIVKREAMEREAQGG